jgi:hypothetical protein
LSQLLAAQQTIQQASKNTLAGLSVGAAATIYYRLGSPRIVGVGEDSVPVNLRRYFHDTAMVKLVAKARRSPRRGPVLKLFGLTDNSHRQDTEGLLIDLGYDVEQ